MPNPKGNPNLGKAAIAAGTVFSATNQPANKPGPRPSKFKQFIKANDIGARDIAEGILWLSDMTEEEIKVVIEDPKTPVLLKAFAKSITAEIERSGLYNIEALLNRALGKPFQTVKMESDVDEQNPIRIQVDHTIDIKNTDTVEVHEPRKPDDQAN
jgi:hypothetical protein